MLISNTESAVRTRADKGREKLIAEFVTDLQRMPIDDLRALRKLAAFSARRAEETVTPRFPPGPDQLLEKLRHAHTCKKDAAPRFIQMPATGRTRQWTCLSCNESEIMLPSKGGA